MSGSSAALVRWQVGERSTRLGAGAPVVGWEELRGGWITEVRAAGMRRSGLDSPAQPWLAWLEQTDELAVVDVVLDDAGAAADLLGFVVEPALRLGIDLEIVADRRLEDCDPEAFFEAQFGYAHALERLRFVVRGSRPRRTATPTLADSAFAPDGAQRRAVQAGGGVVQIIAPAGSGKTAVLVERVRELRRRGVPAKAIVCVTFNKAAKAELAERLTAAGVGDVGALTFHGVGWRILLDAKALREKIDPPTLGQWRLIAMQAMRAAGDDGVFFEPGDAKSHVAEIKLGLLQTPERTRPRRRPTPTASGARSPRCTPPTRSCSSNATGWISTTSSRDRCGCCATARTFARAGRGAGSACSSTSTRTSSPPKSCSCGSSPHRTTSCSASATKTRRCTRFAARASSESSSSTSCTPRSRGSRSRRTTAARAPSSPRPRG